MIRLDRRSALQGALATAALFVCEAAAPALAKAIVPTETCGCPRKHPLSYGHCCIVHDESGKRWDAYTFEDVCKLYRYKASDIVTVKKGDELSCYCGRHHHRRYGKHYLKVGDRGVWTGGGGEQPEYEFACEHGFRDNWLDAQTTDWVAMAIESEKIYQAERARVKV